ncbi:MAG: aspartate--tRNA(Asn) ligase, partial [Candidatus Anstonellales archaeon]
MYRTHFIEEAKKQLEKEVILCGWAEHIRDLGKVVFVILRDYTGRIQCVIKDRSLINAQINREDVIKVRGIVKPVQNAPYGGIEIAVNEIAIINSVKKTLPIDPTEKVKSELETRLNYRFIDLRKDEVKNIFIAKSIAAQTFTKILSKKRFIQIQPPSIIGAASEGGAEVFEVQYFEKKAYLAQSPQLYKQLAVIGGLERVMMIATVFRAEKHHTTYHLNEITSMDVEAAFFDHKDMMALLSDVFYAMLKEMKKINSNIKLVKPIKVEYKKAINKLISEGFDIEYGDDLNREAEQKLCEIFGDAVLIHSWPTKIRAFYSMPYEDNPDLCKSFDLLYKGLEITSGAQRIHDADMLKEQIRNKGLNINDFQHYIEAFYYGAPPHAGFGLGLERFIMKALDINNIREVMLFPRDRTRLMP